MADREGAIDIGGRLREPQARAIDVWPMRLEASPRVVAAFKDILSADELGRAAHFRFDHLQHRYVLARGALRMLLAQYLSIAADLIAFDYGDRGKPRVPGGAIKFNVSHSGSSALLAFTRQFEIGIDIEELRAVPSFPEIAERYYCAEEAAELRSLPEEEREQAFLVCWTRKEAYLKAEGVGLSAPLDAFRVALRRGDPVRFIQFASGAGEEAPWMLHDLSSPPRYAAALAYRGTPSRVCLQEPIEPAELLEMAGTSIAEMTCL